MGFTLTVLVEASILFLNAFTVLNEERFLRKGTICRLASASTARRLRLTESISRLGRARPR